MRTTSFKGVEKFRVVECYTRALPSHVLGLSLFELRMRSETLVSMKFTTEECKPHSDFGFCNFTTGESTTASVKVLISDLINGEMRAYGCDASYYDNQPWTETYTINVTMGGTEEAGATTDNFPADDGTSSRQVFDVTSVATEPPDEAAEHDFRFDNDRLFTVTPFNPADPPERHFFRRPEGSDSTSHYEVVP
ncbi:hypothetical protein BaRGS_00016952 [Batillaria attramentaria]|uniref:Uncharacterized protein n=1 Tax=Batillaria attramentaria TaxID=370345 RepID=A0ABD0KYE6_9CAEN